MEIKTKFNLGDEVFRVVSGSGIQRPTIWKEGTVVGYQTTQAGTEAIVRCSGMDKSYLDDEILTQTEANEHWSTLMNSFIEALKREIAECEKDLEAYEKCKSN